jgi:hypothetical protein
LGTSKNLTRNIKDPLFYQRYSLPRGLLRLWRDLRAAVHKRQGREKAAGSSALEDLPGNPVEGLLELAVPTAEKAGFVTATWMPSYVATRIHGNNSNFTSTEFLS